MIALEDQDGDVGVVQEGESCNVTCQLKYGDTEISKSNLLTLTMTLFDKETNQVINSREDQNVLDANGCSVDSTCNVTIELDENDNAIMGTHLGAGDREQHVVRLTWTWYDGNTNRIGKEELWFWVEKLASPS